MRSRPGTLRRIAAVLFVAALTACGAARQPAAVQALSTAQARAEPAMAGLPRTAFVHLFEWKWTDVARECETYLGPKGFAAVQVSPPNEHALVKLSNGDYPWWQRYQPVSYSVERSRGGTGDELRDMIARCRAVGVDIYADAVINHMTGGGGSDFDGRYFHGSNGSPYAKYDYPGTYAAWDFHTCRESIDDYGDRGEVQGCELSGLSDLDTGSEYVRGRIAQYMIDLANMGVRGFRIDAVKHISPADMAAIVDKVNAAVDPDPYYFQEVIDGGGEAVRASHYLGVSDGRADITEFKYMDRLSKKFLNATYPGGSEKIAELRTFGESWGLLPSDRAIVFTNNHDVQRGHGGGGQFISYHHGRLDDLAHVFMLAWPYGYPSIMSSYAFDPATTAGTDAGPPSDADGNTVSIYPAEGDEPGCFDQTPGEGWICEHRWRPIGNMVAFRNYTNPSWSVDNWWDNGGNQIAFGRGSRGFVVINREDGALSRTFQTGLPAGAYCDVVNGDYDATSNTCSGPTVTVDGAGRAEISVAGFGAAAIYGGARLSLAPPPVPTRFAVEASTAWGENIYVVGSAPALGSWDPNDAVRLSPAGYPTWSGTVDLPASTAVEYKYIKRDMLGNVVWEGGDNRSFTTPAVGEADRTGEAWR